MIAAVHRYLDASRRPTYAYERAATLALEVVLLAACSVPAVTDAHTLAAALVVSALRLYEAELRREDASVAGRHREAGGVALLPEHKLARAAVRAERLEVVTWLWPGLTTMALALGTGELTAATALALWAAVVRAWWGRGVMPAWRASRLAWRAASHL